MAEENREQRQERSAPKTQEEQGGGMYEEAASHVSDAKNYVVQPTSYEIPAHMQVRGEMPDYRFTEEVLKGSDEDFGDGDEAHPDENQPVMGISEDDDELPDTTGRAANRRLKKRDRR